MDTRVYYPKKVKWEEVRLKQSGFKIKRNGKAGD